MGTRLDSTGAAMKRRGILAAAGAVVAGIVAKPVSQPVAAASGGGNQGFLALGSNPWYIAASPSPNSAATFSVYDGATKHNVPKALADYRTKVGFLTIGYARCEPFYATVKVAGTQKQVMM